MTDPVISPRTRRSLAKKILCVILVLLLGTAYVWCASPHRKHPAHAELAAIAPCTPANLRSHGCLIEAPCPPFPIHYASIRQPFGPVLCGGAGIIWCAHS
jgi:hypothetical protein